MTKAKELILGISPQRLQKLKGGGFGGEGAPIRVKLRGAGGEIMGGMLSVAGSQHGGTLSLAGAGTDWMKLAKKAASVAAPLSLVGGPEMAPVAAALGAFSGSGKKNKKKATVRKTKKTVGLAAEIGKILLDTAGKEKEGEALSKVGRVIAGSGKKSKKIKNTIADVSQIAALLGQTSGYMTPQQAAAASAVGQLIQGSGELHGDVFQPPVQHLPPKKTTARPKVAVTGEGHTAPKKKTLHGSPMSHTDVMKHYRAFLRVIEKAMKHNQTTGNVELERMGRQLFGKKFHGVFASDGFPALTSRRPYAIVNTKSAASGGEHWLGVARIPRTGRLLVYDSYGRTHTDLLRTLPPGSEDTERDAEQHLTEKNCGQRALAWLCVVDRLGYLAARKV